MSNIEKNKSINHITLITASLNSGGSERVISELANHFHLLSNQYKITIITLASPQTQPFYQIDTSINLLQIDQTQNNQQSILMRLVNILKRIFCLRKTIRSLKSDLIISFVDIMNITTLIATYWLKIPIIVSERTHPAYYKIPKLYQIFRNLLYPKAAYIVMQTNSAAEYFKNTFKNSKKDNITVIPNAVRKSGVAKANVLLNVKNIISVGRLCPFKGFDTLISAFANVMNNRAEINLTLTIYGEGQERNNLESLIKSLGLQEKVFLPGITKKIPEILLNADLFVFPSMYEGFPNALAEAMAVGLPVIASNCSGNIDLIEDHVNGRLFQIGNINELSNIIQELINDPVQRERLALNAKKITEQYSEQRIYAMWEEIINTA